MRIGENHDPIKRGLRLVQMAEITFNFWREPRPDKKGIKTLDALHVDRVVGENHDPIKRGLRPRIAFRVARSSWREPRPDKKGIKT